MSSKTKFMCGTKYENGLDIHTSGIDVVDNGVVWCNRIECHAETEDEANKLRDRLIEALNKEV